MNGCATKEKRTFFNVRKKVPMATKPRGRGAKGLSGRATKKKKRTFFCGFPKNTDYRERSYASKENIVQKKRKRLNHLKKRTPHVEAL